MMIVLRPPQTLPLLGAAEVADQAGVEVGDAPARVPERVLAEVTPEVAIDSLKVVRPIVWYKKAAEAVPECSSNGAISKKLIPERDPKIMHSARFSKRRRIFNAHLQIVLARG